MQSILCLLKGKMRENIDYLSTTKDFPDAIHYAHIFMEIMQDWLSEEMKRLQYNFIDNLGNYVNISPKFSNNTFRNGSNTIHLKVYKVMLFFRSAIFKFISRYSFQQFRWKQTNSIIFSLFWWLSSPISQIGIFHQWILSSRCSILSWIYYLFIISILLIGIYYCI